MQAARCQRSAAHTRRSGLQSCAIATTCARRAPRSGLVVRAAAVPPGSTVLVAGATGGVGQLVVAKLLERGYTVRAMSRGGKAKTVFPDAGPNLQMVSADLRDPSTLTAGVLGGVQAVCCCTGTTAFPSARWKGGNGPKETDLEATGNLIRAAASYPLGRFVLVTSAGVERQGQLPWSILNAFGVLKYKRQAEQLLEGSGLPFTIIRPSRLTDGPYTSYDLNTLLKATAGSRQDVSLALSDSLLGEASRIACAEAVVQSLAVPATEGKAYALSSKQGEGPGTSTDKWAQLFAKASP